MSFNATVSAGYTFVTGDKATAVALNSLGIPTVTVPDNQSYLINVGSVSAPGVAFNGDANTGLAQLAGVDSASIVVGGSETVRFIAGQTGFVNGTDSAPSITWVGDGDTGINHDTSGQIDFVCDKTVVGQFNTSGLAVVGSVAATGSISATGMTINGANVLTAGINTSQFVYWTDFTGSLASTAFTQAVVATGAVAQVTSRATDTDHRGLLSFSVAATGDRAVIHLPAQIKVGGLIRTRMRVAQLSTSGERFFLMIGLTNNTTDTISSVTGNGAWFQYIDSASAQWQTITMDAGTKETQTTDVTVAAAGTWYTLDLYRVGASDYRFYVNGVLKTTHVTSVESGIDFNYFAFIMEKTVGSGTVVAYIDTFEITNPLTRT